MPSYNAENYISEAIDSVLKQSFADFEFIIIDDGSTDNTLSIIQSYKDDRIKLIKNKHNYIDSLNLGITAASGKYIARMDADDIMNVDRLKIQHSILEEEQEITVCSCWMTMFGYNSINGITTKSIFGIIENPLVQFLKKDFVLNPTTMIRRNFITDNSLRYKKKYIYAEDYKWWVEVAKLKGVFYIEPQSLHFYRISEGQASNKYKKIQEKTSVQIKNEIINYLISKNSRKDILSELHDLMVIARKNGLIDYKDIWTFFFNMFNNNNLLYTSGFFN